MGESKDDRTELLARLREGGAGADAAFEELLSLYQGRLLQFVERKMYGAKVRRAYDPADIVQSAFVDARNGLRAYLSGAEPMDFYAWLNTLVSQRVSKAARAELALKRGGRAEPAAVADGSGGPAGDLTAPSEAARRSERTALVRLALVRLPEKYREVVRMRVLQEMENRAVAAALGVSEGHATRLYQEAVARLEEILRERGASEDYRP